MPKENNLNQNENENSVFQFMSPTSLNDKESSIVSIEKDAIRKRMIGIIKNEIKPSMQEVMQKITSLEDYKKANILIGYCPLKSEIDVSQVLDKAIEDGKKVLLPDLKPGYFREAKKDWKDKLVMLENKTKTVDTHELISIVDDIVFSNVAVIVLVPALAFTKDGTRLGRGSGYYDQLLEKTSGSKITTKITTVGICSKSQVVQELPRQPHDKKVNLVIAF